MGQYMTTDGLQVQGTLVSVPVETLQPGDLVIQGHCTRRVIGQDGVYLGMVRVAVSYANGDGRFQHHYRPGTAVLIIRSTTT
jgi:hypothetical protein